jgi:ubiquinone/menaquinone biosynthesis C-methylase UbiE
MPHGAQDEPTTRSSYWDDHAAAYDRATAPLERRLLAPARRWVAERVRGSTLEVGVGTGANLPHYVHRADEVVAVDASPAMLDQARRRPEARGVELLAADAAGLPFDDARFDTVVCTFTLCCVPDERTVLRELARVVRPDGLVLVADHVESSSALGRGAQRLLDAVTPAAAGEHHRRRPSLLVDEAGLTLVERQASRWRLVERFAARRLS